MFGGVAGRQCGRRFEGKKEDRDRWRRSNTDPISSALGAPAAGGVNGSKYLLTSQAGQQGQQRLGGLKVGGLLRRQVQAGQRRLGWHGQGSGGRCLHRRSSRHRWPHSVRLALHLLLRVQLGQELLHKQHSRLVLGPRRWGKAGLLMQRRKQSLPRWQRRLRLLLLLVRRKHGGQVVRSGAPCQRLRLLLRLLLEQRRPCSSCCALAASAALHSCQLQGELDQLQPGRQLFRCSAAICRRRCRG